MTALIYPRKVKIADPKLIYGWQSTDTFKSEALHAIHHSDEVVITNYSTVEIEPIIGYVASVNSKIVKSESLRKFNSDAYLPPGTRVTMFMVEYEAFDRYCDEWVWTPSPRLLWYDAVWIERLVKYRVAERAEPTTDTSPRSIRLRRVIRQVRQEDWSWSTPVDVPASDLIKRVDGEVVEEGYASFEDIPHWDIPSGYEGDVFGAEPMFVLIERIAPKVALVAEQPPTLAPEIEPAEHRGALIIADNKANAGAATWEGAESPRQLCFELVRLVLPLEI